MDKQSFMNTRTSYLSGEVSSSNDKSWQYLKDNVWLQVVIGISGVFVILILIFICIYCRRKCRRYDFSAREEEVSLLKKWENEKKVQVSAERGSMMLNCQFYLRNTGKYTVSSHLPDIGSRIGRNWFLVSDHTSSDAKDRLLTMTPTTKQYSSLSINQSMKRTLRELYSALQHPYIFPVYEMDMVVDQEFVVVTQPFQTSGSLKDLIYNTKPRESWEIKYKRKGKSLSIELIKNYGRQILEALVFLREFGFPSIGHVHSGNIFITNRVCRLSGYENVLVGHVSRLSQTIRKLVKDNKEATEVVCFGHLLFEMAAGYELDASEPESHHLASCKNTDIVECLNFIFSNNSHTFPTLEELINHKLFSGVQTQKVNKQVKLSSQLKTLLKQMRKDMLQPTRSTRKKSTRKKSENIQHTEHPSSNSSSKTKSVKQKEIMKTFPPPPKHSFATPPPPPAPPPTAPPPPPMSNIPPVKTTGGTGRSALLQSITKGTKLKKAVTVDKSTPRV